MDWKAAKPYVTAFIVALIGALFASGGVALTYLARENEGLAAILGAGFAVLIGFARVLPSVESIVHHEPQTNVEKAQTVNVNNPPADAPADTPAKTAITPSPPPTRNPQGQFARRVPPIDPLSDH